jgi:hypothetical protein
MHKMQLNTCSYVNKITKRKVHPLLSTSRFGMATKCWPPPFPVEIPRKLKEISKQKTTPYRVFLHRWVLVSIRLQGELFSRTKTFLLFKCLV